MTKARRATAPRHQRAPFDWYVEPRWAVEALFDAYPMLGTVGDPACGRGTIPEVAWRRGHVIVAADLVDRGYERLSATEDFLCDEAVTMQGVDNIVCNPPYSYRPGIAEAFARRALLLARQTIALIVPTAWLTSEVRFRLFAAQPPSRLLILSERPSMPPGHLIEAMGSRAFRGGAIDYCWVIWSKLPDGRLSGGAEVSWIPPRPPEARR